MFARKSHHYDSFSKNRARKSVSKSKKSFRDNASTSRRVERPRKTEASGQSVLNSDILDQPSNANDGSNPTSPIITLCVGPEQRLFAAHEDILCHSSFFAALCRGQFLESTGKRVNLPEEIPEVFSSVLEYLYKGDYYPRLLHNKRRNTWELEDTATDAHGRPCTANTESTVIHPGTQQPLLKETLIYCTAERYGLDELKRLALRKQGLQSGIQCSTILASARYAYANTPDTDAKLRSHYLALIIRSRATFKRSGTMQMEMEAGGKLYVMFLSFFCLSVPRWTI